MKQPKYQVKNGWIFTPLEVCKLEDVKRNEDLDINIPLEYRYDDTFRVRLDSIIYYRQFLPKEEEEDDIKRSVIGFGSEELVIAIEYKELDKLLIDEK